MKTKIVIFFQLICLMGCYGKVSLNNAPMHLMIQGDSPDTIQINLKKSIIKWKGTKMRGLGKHEGTIGLKSGYLLTTENKISGGRFIIDMHSIDVTDIPKHEPVPRKNLISHLKSDDFFDVEKYHTSELIILSSQQTNQNSLKLNACLTIKGITNQISFEANKVDDVYLSLFEIDRFKWNIAYTGSWVNRTLVDQMILIDLKVQTKTPIK